jgi:hypothetical protein
MLKGLPDPVETVEVRSSAGPLGHVLFMGHNALNFSSNLRDGFIAIPDFRRVSHGLGSE